MVVRQDDGRRVQRQARLDDFAGIDRGLRHCAAEHLLQLDDTMLRVQEDDAEDFVFQHADRQAQVVLHVLRRRQRHAGLHALRQHAPGLRQNFVGTGHTVLAIDVTDQQRVREPGFRGRDSEGERGLRHVELRS